MSDAENAFAEATDNLIRLYRGIERRTLDLPPISLMPMVIWFWAILRFYFFFIVGLVLIVPVNLVILIRNRFHGGHWRYRPFFLHHLYYVWLWIWRGEVPAAPFIFVRPLFNVFVKGHFERRLRRLRLEVLLRDELSDATRSTLLARLDAALERWKSPRFVAIYTMLLPTIAAVPASYEQLVKFLGLFDIHIPAGVVGKFISEHTSPVTVLAIGLTSLTYLLAILITSSLAKRGLFLGADTNSICFPGGQEGSGFYSKEKEILGSVGLHVREAPIDLWLFGASTVLGLPTLLLQESSSPDFTGGARWVALTIQVLLIGFSFIAALRRKRTGRA